MPRRLPAGGILRFPFRLVFGSHRAVPRRNAVIRRPLEHRDLRGFLGDDGYPLYGRGARADHGDAPTHEAHRLMRPFASVEGSAFKGLDTGKIGHASRREAAGRHHNVAGNDSLAGARMHPPTCAGLVEDRGVDARVEGYEAAEVKPVGDMVRIAENFRLRGKQLAPLPVPLQFLREAERILHALDVATGAGIAVPVPGAANTATGLKGAHGKTELAEAMQQIKAGEASTDDEDVDLLGLPHRGLVRGLVVERH